MDFLVEQVVRMIVHVDRASDGQRRAVRSRHLREALGLDRRSMKHLEQQAHSLVEVGGVLGLSQPTLSSALKSARSVPAIAHGS
jgi:hypothetical protein